MIASPPPVLRMPIGGTCDANGNLTMKSIVPSRSWYGVFTAILKVSSGAPQWEIDLLGMPVGVAGGGSAVMGAVYSNPEDSFTLIVTGAAPNAVVSGGLYGFLAAEPEQLPQLGAISSGGGGGSSGVLPGGQIVARGTLAAVGDVVAIPAGGAAYVSFAGLGIFNAPSVIKTEGTTDDATWIAIPNLVFNQTTALWGVSALQGDFSGSEVIVATAGLSQVRLRVTNVSGGGFPKAVIARAAPGAGIPLPFGQQLMASSQPVVIASDQSGVPVTFAATQKPLAFQNRVAFAATVTQVASVAAEAMLTLVPVRAGVAGAGVTTIPVTAGKVLRITEMTVNYRNNAAAAHFTRFTLRTNPTGAAVVASPALDVAEAYATAALALVGQAIAVPFPDGLEFTGTEQIGVSHLCDAAAVGFSSVGLTGFEYTP